MKVLLGLMLLLCISGCDVNPAERVNAGNEHFSRGDYPAALAAYQAAQVAAPDLPQPYFNAGSAFALSGQYQRAAAALQQALKSGQPELMAPAYYNLGNVQFAMSRFDEAVQSYQQALLLNPNDQDARHNLELALRRILPPEATPDATPTGSDGNTPTPQPDSASSPTATMPAQPQPASTLSAKEAEQLLDAIQRGQQTLRGHLQTAVPPDDVPEKDW